MAARLLYLDLQSFVVSLILAGLLAGCAAQSTDATTVWYAMHDGVAPRDDRIYVCHSFGCARKTAVDFSSADLKNLRRMIGQGADSPASERKAIASAVAWNERRVAPVVGSADDEGGFDLRKSGIPGQMDCIDEASNTTSLLLVAERHGMLKHHIVLAPVARGVFIDGRYPHATAVIAERGGRKFAIDSWPMANGLTPLVQDLDVWFSSYTHS